MSLLDKIGPIGKNVWTRYALDMISRIGKKAPESRELEEGGFFWIEYMFEFNNYELVFSIKSVQENEAYRYVSEYVSCTDKKTQDMYSFEIIGDRIVPLCCDGSISKALDQAEKGDAEPKDSIDRIIHLVEKSRV